LNLFSLGFTTEALRENIDWKSAFLKEVGQFRPNFHVEGDVPTNYFCTDRLASECRTTWSLTVVTQSALIEGKRSFCSSEPPLKSLGATYAVHLIGSLESA